MHSSRRFQAGLLFLALLILLMAGCSKNPQKYIANGKQYFDQGKYREAIIEFRNAIKADPNLSEAHYNLALGQIVTGQFADAYQTLLKAVQLNSDNTEAQLYLGNLLLLERKFEDARLKADLILKRNPSSLRALILLGNTYSQMVQLDGSIGEIKQGFQRDPRFLPSYIDLADRQDARRPADLIEDAYKKAAAADQNSVLPKLALANFYSVVKRSQEAEKLLQDTVAAAPKSADASNALGFFLLQNKRIGEAEAAYTRVRDAHPNEVLPKIVLADFLMGTGQTDRAMDSYRKLAADNSTKLLGLKRLVSIHLSRREFDKAGPLVNEILKVDAKDADGQLLRGQLLLMQKKTLEAMQALEVVVKAKPSSAQAHYFLGLAQVNSGNIQTGESELTMALRLDGTLTQAYLMLAQLKLNAGDAQMAATLARRALAGNANLGEARLILGNALLNTGDYEGAKNQLDEFVKQNPSNDVGHHRLGAAHMALNNPQQAEQQFEMALTANPQSFDALGSLAQLYVLQKNPQKALDRINRAIEHDPKQAKLYQILGQTYMEMKNQAKAEEAFVKAASIDPKNAAQRQVLSRFYESTGQSGKSVENMEALVKENPANMELKAQLANIYFTQKAYGKAEAIAGEILKANPKNPDGLVLRGRILLTQNKIADALTQLQAAVNLAPNSAIARYALGLAHLQSGNRKAAESEWIEGARNPGRFVAPVLALAQLKLESNNADEALRYAQQVSTIDPNNKEALLIRGSARLLKKDYGTAAIDLGNYVQANPDNAVGHQRLGAACLQNKDFPRAELQFEDALKINPAFTDALAGIASLYLQQKNPEKAIQRMNQQLGRVSGPAQAPVLRLLAELYVSQKDTSRAEEMLKKAIQADPKNPAFRTALASFYEVNGNTAKSAEVMESLVMEQPGNDSNKMQLAALYLEQKSWDKGLRVIEEVLKAKPKDVGAHILKSRLLVGQGKADAAIAAAQAAINADPKSAGARIALGQAYYAKDPKSPQVESAWTEAINVDPNYVNAYLYLSQLKLTAGDQTSAIRYGQQALRVDQNAADAHMLLGSAYAAQEDYKNAAAEYQAFLKSRPGNSTALSRLGIVYARMKNTAMAEQVLSQALKEDPNNPELLATRTNISLSQNNPAKALQVINQQIAQSPNQPRLYEIQGQIYENQKDYVKAEQSFRKVLSLDSNNLNAYSFLGRLYIKQNSTDKAIREFENALKINPKSPQIWVIIGSIYEQQNNAQKAMQSYREALKIDPGFAVAANNLAWLMGETGGNLEEAISLARLAKQKLPDAPNVSDTLGWTYYRSGAYRSAVEALKESVEKGPKNPVFHYHLGMSYFKMGDKANAKSSLAEALRLNSGFRGADEARGILAKL